MQLHKLKKNESRTQDGEPVHLTQKAIEELKEHLAKLKRRLPDLALEAQRTAAYGDRSDNAEYKQAKGALRRAHYQIFEIETKLKFAVPIPTGPNTTGAVHLGSTVVLEPKGGETSTRKTYEILGPHETNPAEGRISYLSPLGAALIGHKKDDMIAITTGDRERVYRIVEIS